MPLQGKGMEWLEAIYNELQAPTIPSGAATYAGQTAGNASLSSIAADIALMKADLAAIRAILES